MSDFSELDKAPDFMTHIEPTNFNTRLDELVERIRRGMHKELGGDSPHLEAGFSREEAKADIKQLFLEIIGEVDSGEIVIEQAAYNDGYYSGVTNGIEAYIHQLRQTIGGEQGETHE